MKFWEKADLCRKARTLQTVFAIATSCAVVYSIAYLGGNGCKQ